MSVFIKHLIGSQKTDNTNHEPGKKNVCYFFNIHFHAGKSNSDLLIDQSLHVGILKFEKEIEIRKAIRVLLSIYQVVGVLYTI